jgi:hypothetical protein
MTRTITNCIAPAVGDTIALIDVDDIERHFRLYGYNGKPFEQKGEGGLGFYIGECRPVIGRPNGNIWFKYASDYTTYVLPSFTDAEKLAEIRNILEGYDPEHVVTSDVWQVLDS